jgi:hypothetical protein
MKAESLCTRCLEYAPLERHHMFPQRFFGNGSKNRSIILLCTKCHKKIEAILPQNAKLSKEEYIRIHQEFLSDIPQKTFRRPTHQYTKKWMPTETAMATA